MAASSLIVRPLSSPEEYAWQFHLANQAFSEHPSPEGAQRWQHYLTNLPEFQPEQLRGAFRDDELLGGYLMYERLLRMGAAAIPTGCIGIRRHPSCASPAGSSSSYDAGCHHVCPFPWACPTFARRHCHLLSPLRLYGCDRPLHHRHQAPCRACTAPESI